MLVLTSASAKEKLKRQASRDNDYSEALELEDAIRLHTVGDSDDLKGFERFIKWAENQLSSEKYKEFVDVIRFPLPTVGVVGSIFDDLGKVFEAENSTFSAIRFKEAGGINGKKFDAEFNFKGIMKEKLFKTFKAHPNSFFVVEKDEEGKPRVYFVHLENYIDHAYNEHNELQYLAWQVDSKGDHKVVLDSKYFHHFTKAKGKGDYDYEAVEHNLGFVPADLIYKEFFEEDKKLKVNSPLARKVGELDWLLFWKLAKKVNDKMSPFPIYSHYEFECDYVDPATNTKCDGAGNIFFEEEHNGTMVMKSKICPSCSRSDSSRMIAGSRVKIPAPQTKEDVDLRNPVQVLNSEVKNTEYVTKEEERLENSIYYSVVGKSLVALDTFSASVNQIDIATEARKNVLMNMAKILLQAHSKIVDCYGRYLYPQQYLGNSISYGDNWFLRTDEEEIKLYESYAKASMTQQIRVSQLKQIIKNRFSTDVDERTKQLLLLDLEPFPLMTTTEVMELYAKGGTTKEVLVQKLYFNDIVRDLEEIYGHIGVYLNISDTKKSDKLKDIRKQISTLSEPYLAFISSIDSKQEEQNQNQNQNGNKSRQD